MRETSCRSLRCLGLALFVFGSGLVAAHEGDDEKKPDCEKQLESPLTQEKIVEAYQRYKKINRAFGVDFRLKKGATKPSARVQLGLSPSTADFSRIWTYGGRIFRFMSVGLKALEGEVQDINRIVAEHILAFSAHDLVIDYSPERVDAISRLTQYRWFVQHAILARYRQQNEYLSDRDLFMLNWSSRRSFNSDIFAVLADEVGQHLTRQGVQDRLMVTVQINYPGFFDFLSPNLIGVMQNQAFQSLAADARLPFELRLHRSIAKMFRFSFYERFPREQTCEFSEYAAFRSIPPPVQDRLMLEAFQTALKRKMQVIVVVASGQAELLFSEYGFSRYLPFLAKHQRESEHLLYLDLGSEGFRRQMQGLKERAQGVSVFKAD